MNSRHGRSVVAVVMPALLVACLAGCSDSSTTSTSTTATATGKTSTAPGPGVSRADLDSAMEAARSRGGDTRRMEVLNIAMKELGKKYAWGGDGPDAWDCSGLVKHVFAEVGVELPRVTYDQVHEGTAVPRGKYEPADLLFFDRNGHIGIYISDGLMIHAKGRVKVEKVSHYPSSISAARRVLL